MKLFSVFSDVNCPPHLGSSQSHQRREYLSVEGGLKPPICIFVWFSPTTVSIGKIYFDDMIFHLGLKIRRGSEKKVTNDSDLKISGRKTFDKPMLHLKGSRGQT